MKTKWTALVAHSTQSKDKYSRPHLEIWAEAADMTIEDAHIAQHARELLEALEDLERAASIFLVLVEDHCPLQNDEMRGAYEDTIGEISSPISAARAAIRKPRGEQ